MFDRSEIAIVKMFEVSDCLGSVKYCNSLEERDSLILYSWSYARFNPGLESGQGAPLYQDCLSMIKPCSQLL